MSKWFFLKNKYKQNKPGKNSGLAEGMKKRLVLMFAVSLLSVCFLDGCAPKDTETMAKANEAMAAGDYEKAVELYDAAIAEEKQLQACYRGKGIALMSKLEYESAEECFSKALESATLIEKNFYHDGMENDIRRYLASCYIHLGEPEKAILIYDALIASDDKDVTLLTERGTAKAATKDLEGAKADFDKAINMDRRNYAMILEIAQTLNKYGGRDIGTAYLADVSSLKGNQIDPVLKGKILYFLKDYEGALELLKPFAETDDLAAAITCKCYIALGETDTAKDLIYSLGDRANASPDLLNILGSICMKQRRYKDATKVYERAIKAAEGTPAMQDLLFNRAVAYEYWGKFDTARDLFAEYVRQYSGDKLAVRELQFLNTR